MSFMEDMSDAAMSIAGEMWLCADSARPSKVGAGRGLKNFITIEKDRFCAYSSRSTQGKQIKEIAFRSMKRVAWFTHHPKPAGGEPSAAAAAAAARRRVAKDPLAATYYYLVLEFLRDNTAVNTLTLGKRERIVLCTDDQQDFSIWKKFADMYQCPPVHERYVEGRERRPAKEEDPAGGAPDHDDTTSSDDDRDSKHGGGGSGGDGRLLDVWRNRCVALLNDFAHLSDPSLQVESASVFETAVGSGGVDWDARAELVLHAIEQDMRPAMKVVPPKAGAAAADDNASSSSLVSSPLVAAAGARPGGRAGSMEKRFDEMRSQASNLRVELEQYQAVAAEVGSLVEGRELPATKMSPDTLHTYLERLREKPTPKDLTASGATAKAERHLANAATAESAKLERACGDAVQRFTAEVHSSALCLAKEANRERAIQQERASLPQQVETVFAVLLDELTSANADIAKLKMELANGAKGGAAALPESASLELNQLRKTLNRKEMELEALQQEQFDAGRRSKQLSRRFEELMLAFADGAHDMLRSQYREYASVRNLFLTALRGEVPVDNSAASGTFHGAGGSFGESRHGTGASHASAGMQRLVVSAAHIEAIQALEHERTAAREKQQELEDVMTELDALRQERDEDIANVKRNFLAAKEGWEKDVTVLQAKVAALQSAIPRGTVLLPATAPLTNAAEADIAERLKATQAANSTTDTAIAAGPDERGAGEGEAALQKVAVLLATSARETHLENGVVAQRLQAFYEWALETVVPLTATASADGSLLELITNVAHAYQSLLHETSIVYAAHSAEPGAAARVDVLAQMKSEHGQLAKLWGTIQQQLIEPRQRDAAASQQTPTEQTATPALPSDEDVDKLPPLLATVCAKAAQYVTLAERCDDADLASYIQGLESRSAQLETQQQLQLQQEHALQDLSARLQHSQAFVSEFTNTTAQALASLGVDAAAEEPVGAVVARAAAEAAERERALQADVAATKEQVQRLEQRLAAALEAASAEQEQLRADRDERLRSASVTMSLQDGALSVSLLETAEAEYRSVLLNAALSSSPYLHGAGESLALIAGACTLLCCTPTSLLSSLSALLASHTKLKEFVAGLEKEAVWHEDPAVATAFRRLDGLLREGAQLGGGAAADFRSLACLASALRNGYEMARGLSAESVVQAQAITDLSQLAQECGRVMRDSTAALRCVDGEGESSEGAASTPRAGAAVPLDGSVRASCRALSGAVAESLVRQEGSKAIMTATLRTLSEACGGDSTHGRPVTDDSQLPRLAKQVCAELAGLRAAAELEGALAQAIKQRDALCRVAESCSAVLRSAAHTEDHADVEQDNAAAAPSVGVSAEQAQSTLTDATSLAQVQLHRHSQALHRALSVLHPLAEGLQDAVAPATLQELLVRLCDAVRSRVDDLERGLAHARAKEKRNGEARAGDDAEHQRATVALEERCGALEAALRRGEEAGEVQRAAAATAALQLDAVVRLCGGFADSVSATLPRPESAPDRDGAAATAFVRLLRACTAPHVADARAELGTLEARLAAVATACQQRAAEHRRADAALARLTEEHGELRANLEATEQRWKEAKAQTQVHLAALQAADAALEEQRAAAAQARLADARAHEEALGVAAQERSALVADVSQVRREAEAAQVELAALQARLAAALSSHAEAMEAKEQLEGRVAKCIAAVGRVGSLEQVVDAVAAYKHEYKKKSMESKEARRRRELVQEWASTQARATSAELQLLRDTVAGLSHTFPNVPLTALQASAERASQSLAEAERLLGATVSAASRDGATREELLEAVRQAGVLLADASPSRRAGSVSRVSGRLGDSLPVGGATVPPGVRLPAASTARWAETPALLLDAVVALLAERQALRASVAEATKTDEDWRSAVAREVLVMHTALSAAAAVTDVLAGSGDGPGAVESLPRCTAADEQAELLHALDSTALCVATFADGTLRVCQAMRAQLQQCLASTTSALPDLVRDAVAVIAGLRAGSQSTAQALHTRDEEVAALAALLQEVSAAVPDGAAFFAAGSNTLQRCKAYVRECARLGALERELGSVLADTGGTAPGSRSLVEEVAALARERVQLRDGEVPRLAARGHALEVEALLAEERAARAELALAQTSQRVRDVAAPWQRDLSSAVTRLFARATAAAAQDEQRSVQLRTLQEAHEPLVAAAMRLPAVQQECRRSLATAFETSTAPDLLRAVPAAEPLPVVEHEAGLAALLVKAHDRLVAQCTELTDALARTEADSARVALRTEEELAAARERAKALQVELDCYRRGVYELGGILLPDHAQEGDSVPRLAALVDAAAQLTRELADEGAARRRLEKEAREAADAMAELQSQCTTAAADIDALQSVVRRHERHEAEEVRALKAAVKTASDAFADLTATLSGTPPAAAPASAAAVDETQWTQVVLDVRGAVQEVRHQTGIAGGLGSQLTSAQARVKELKALVDDDEARESQLLHRLNALVQSSDPLSAAVAALAASQEPELASLEDVAVAMHAAAQLVAQQHSERDVLLRRVKELQGAVAEGEAAHGALRSERDAATGAASQLEAALQSERRGLAQLEGCVRNAFSAVDQRIAAVIGPGESARLDTSTPADCLDGLAYLVDVLAVTAEEGQIAKAKLAGHAGAMQAREAANAATTASLSALWQAFCAHLLPQLVDAPSADPGRRRLSDSTTAADCFASEAETAYAVQVVEDSANRLRRAHEEVQFIHDALRSHFGGDGSTTVTDVTGTPRVPGAAEATGGAPTSRLDETVSSTLRLVNTVVTAKCTSVRDFIEHVFADVLEDTAVCGRVAFAALRPGAFVEWLQGALARLVAVRERAHRLPGFMDALVEAIHAHGGHVDVAAVAGGASLLLDTHCLRGAEQQHYQDPTASVADWQAREQAAIVYALRSLLALQDERVQALAAECRDAVALCSELRQEHDAAAETIMELRPLVQFKVQEDHKLEESLRELDLHLDQQARELALKYRADHDLIVRRFTTLRDTIHATMRPPLQRTTPAKSTRTPRRSVSTPRH